MAAPAAAASSGSLPKLATFAGEPVAKPAMDAIPERARSLATKTYRPVFWHDDMLFLIDQRALPTDFELTSCNTVAMVGECINLMVVRGAPAIGAAGAYGLVIGARKALSDGGDLAAVVAAAKAAKVELDAARPTAVNLEWATARMAAIAEALAGM